MTIFYENFLFQNHLPESFQFYFLLKWDKFLHLISSFILIILRIIFLVKSHISDFINIHILLEPRHEKTSFCICENKGADQLCGNPTTDQRLCFRYTDSPIPLLSKSEISNLKPSSVAVQPGLCQTWSETPKTGFLTTRPTYFSSE